MNKNRIIAGAAILAALGVATFATSSQAFWGKNGCPGGNCDSERYQQMTQAFQDNDYAAWKELMGDRGAAQKINKENFARFAEMHSLMKEGKVDEANTIRKELGIGNGRGMGGYGMKGNNRGQNKGGNFVDENKDGICDHRQ